MWYVKMVVPNIINREFVLIKNIFRFGVVSVRSGFHFLFLILKKPALTSSLSLLLLNLLIVVYYKYLAGRPQLYIYDVFFFLNHHLHFSRHVRVVLPTSITNPTFSY
mgnify:CR=1 FL=1